MKKQTLRWLSRIMAVIMLLVTLPLPELKVFAADEHYGIWIGNEEFTSDHREIQGKQGKATVGEFGYGKDRTVTFSGNFVPKDGSDGVYTAANGRKYLVYIAEDTNYSSTFVEFDGKASFSSTDPQVMGLGSEAEMELVIAQGAEIEFKTENTALNIPEGDIYVETDGKLTVDVELQNGDSEISAVYASTLENLGTVDV